jgi:hypothetical protein
MSEKESERRIGRSDADCVVCVLRHLHFELSRHLPESATDEKIRSRDLYNFLIDFLSERTDSENCLALWKLGEELNATQLVDAAVAAVQV